MLLCGIFIGRLVLHLYQAESCTSRDKLRVRMTTVVRFYLVRIPAIQTNPRHCEIPVGKHEEILPNKAGWKSCHV